MLTTESAQRHSSGQLFAAPELETSVIFTQRFCRGNCKHADDAARPVGTH